MSEVIREAREAARIMSPAPILALDIETSGLRCWQGQIMTYNLADGEGNIAVIHTPSGSMPDPIRDLLSQERGWVTHNGTNFDLHWLQSVHRPRQHDPLVMLHAVLSSHSAHSKVTPSSLNIMCVNKIPYLVLQVYICMSIN